VISHRAAPDAPPPTPTGALRTRHDVTTTTFDITAALIIVLDRAGRIIRFNPACERLAGLREADIVGQLLWPLVLDDTEAERAAAAYAQLQPGQAAATYRNSSVNAQGKRRYLNWTLTQLQDAAGQIDLVVATGLDVTEERQAHLARQESEARFRALFERSGDGVVLIDPHDPRVPWRIVECNAAFERMNGYAQGALIGQSIDLLHTEPLMAQKGNWLLDWVRAQGEEALAESTHRHHNGSVFPIETRSSLIILGGKELVLGIDRDISERKRAEAQLRGLNEQLAFEAHHDALTGLPNRAKLIDQLTLELDRARRSGAAVAVMFVDLDDFKRVNDTLGHAAGDELLRIVAERVRRTLRPSDTIARVGGDEFVVLIPDVRDMHHTARVARRLQDAVALPVTLGGLVITVGSSIGISFSCPETSDVDELLRHADLAMYEIKKESKNGVRFFEPVMNAASQARMRMEARLHQAIAEKSLTLHYQPQVDVESGQLVGLEALARWTDAELGVVSPGEFIPIAEDTGQIVALGTWVLDEACRQAAEWALNIPVAVNVSPAQLLRPDFLDTVASTLERHQLPPHHLKLELTERLALRDPQLAAQQLGSLRALGVTLSLDDFGAGQSAFASLLNLPLQELKLDRSLLKHITEDPASWQVLGALLSLARGLHLPVVVEGVETPMQLEVLRALECGTVQGYLTGRPEEASVVTRRLSPERGKDGLNHERGQGEGQPSSRPLP